MPAKTLPFDKPRIEAIAAQYPTPFYLYDERGIRENAQRLTSAFSHCPGFKEYFAVKASPNPYLLEILREEGFGADCSSRMELLLCEEVGFRDHEIMFTSNNTLASDYAKALELGALLNLDDLSHVDYLAEQVGMPESICFRYNPGPLREGNAIIGKPEEAKYGFTRPQLLEGYQRAQQLGARRFGLHTMVASNELNPEFFVETAQMLFQLVVEVAEKTGIRIQWVNLGGGIGIPYHPSQQTVDLAQIASGVESAYDKWIRPAGLDPLQICMENGRMITGPYGYLITSAVHEKHIYKDYVGVDACMSNLMRPGMYGAYHHITVLGKEDAPADQIYDVVGSLCENNDKFAVDRALPTIERDDLLVIHDAGAHGHAMGFQYNGKLRSAELLLRQDGSVQRIRREETAADYFVTLDYPGLG